MNQTYIKVKGIWHCLYRGVAKGRLIIDSSSANKATPEELNGDNDTASHEVCQVKYLNEIVDQDRRGVKRIINSMLGLKSPDSATTIAGGI